MRNAFRSFIALCSILFLFGAVAAWRHWIDANSYIILTGVVGSIASVVGLIALGNKSISSKDFKQVEVELIKDLSSRMQQLQEYEKRVSAGREEINRLATERANLEILVRQASLKIFLEERLSNTAQELSNRIASDGSLLRLIDEYHSTKSRLKEIGANIERSDRADLIEGILEEIREDREVSKNSIIEISVGGIIFDIGPVYRGIRDLFEAYVGILKI